MGWRRKHTAFAHAVLVWLRGRRNARLAAKEAEHGGKKKKRKHNKESKKDKKTKDKKKQKRRGSSDSDSDSDHHRSSKKRKKGDTKAEGPVSLRAFFEQGSSSSDDD